MKTKIYESLADLFPLWRETTLGESQHEKQETSFVLDVFKRGGKINTIIDLGGGVGLHAGLLSMAGYDVTLFDQSEKALSIAKENNPSLKIIHGSFENMDVGKKYDAAICLWSTLAYVLSEKGRKNFYNWQKAHIKQLIVLDEANFYKYPSKFHREYSGENETHKMKVIRDWKLTRGNLRDTRFTYEVFDKATGKNRTIKDAEKQQYVSVEQLEEYLGPAWALSHLYGDYDLKRPYDRQQSPRIIPVFHKRTA